MADLKSLGTMFKEDFGVDLPVSGHGGGPDSPFLITVDDAQHAVDVQAAVINLLARGQQLPWRFVSQEVIGATPVRTRTAIEICELTDLRFALETRRYYFDWGGPAAVSSIQILPMPTGFTDAHSGVALPYELGWLHLERAMDNEAETPGLGTSVQYGSSLVRGSVFVYDLGRRVESDDAERIEAEFQNSIEDVLRLVPESSVLGVNQLPSNSGKVWWRLALLAVPGKRTSAVLLSTIGGVFVKGRITWEAMDKQTDEIGLTSLRALVDCLDNSSALRRN